MVQLPTTTLASLDGTRCCRYGSPGWSLTRYAGLEESSCLCLLNGGITDLSHQAWLTLGILNFSVVEKGLPKSPYDTVFDSYLASW